MREGTRYKFRSLLFWAQGGLICIEDARDNSFKAETVRDFLLRANAINGEIPRMGYTDERLEHQKFVEDAICSCRQAKQQGQPDDPKAMADMLKMRRRSVLYASGPVSQHKKVVLAAGTLENRKLPPIPGFKPRSRR